MGSQPRSVELTFLGSGNAFAAEGRAFSSFLLDGRYLFDCGPTVLQQLQKLHVPSENVDAVFISHFHADHFFGLPFLFLEAWHTGRRRDLTIVGPPGIEERAERVMEIGYPGLAQRMDYARRYVEVRDGLEAEAAGLAFTAAEVVHVAELTCFAYRAHLHGRSIVYSGDTTLCDGLLRLVPGADAVVVECCGGGEAVHMSPADVAGVQDASPGARVIVTHLDGVAHLRNPNGPLVAQDLARFEI